MATKKRNSSKRSSEEILQDILMVQLAIAGLTQRQIREVVGVDIYRVGRVVKHIKRGTE